MKATAKRTGMSPSNVSLVVSEPYIAPMGALEEIAAFCGEYLRSKGFAIPGDVATSGNYRALSDRTLPLHIAIWRRHIDRIVGTINQLLFRPLNESSLALQ